MAANVELIDPGKIAPNPDNPRLIFRIQELEELEESIASQGILVPLSVYDAGRSKYVLIDGERRWRCARKLGLHRVPAIIQERPARVQNIMMMFAIHNARRDWDPLPTALKLQELETELQKLRGRRLTETELAASASLSRGAVRRYRKILRIPEDLQQALLKDLQDPSQQEAISVDQVIEAVDAAEALKKVGVVDDRSERVLVDTIVAKFRAKIIKSTVEPRKLGAIGRSISRGDIEVAPTRSVLRRFVTRSGMTIQEVVSQTIEEIEERRTLERNLAAFTEKWLSHLEQNRRLVPRFRKQIEDLVKRLRALI